MEAVRVGVLTLIVIVIMMGCVTVTGHVFGKPNVRFEQIMRQIVTDRVGVAGHVERIDGQSARFGERRVGAHVDDLLDGQYPFVVMLGVD